MSVVSDFCVRDMPTGVVYRKKDVLDKLHILSPRVGTKKQSESAAGIIRKLDIQCVNIINRDSGV